MCMTTHLQNRLYDRGLFLLFLLFVVGSLPGTIIFAPALVHFLVGAALPNIVQTADVDQLVGLEAVPVAIDGDPVLRGVIVRVNVALAGAEEAPLGGHAGGWVTVRASVQAALRGRRVLLLLRRLGLIAALARAGSRGKLRKIRRVAGELEAAHALVRVGGVVVGGGVGRRLGARLGWRRCERSDVGNEVRNAAVETVLRVLLQRTPVPLHDRPRAGVAEGRGAAGRVVGGGQVVVPLGVVAQRICADPADHLRAAVAHAVGVRSAAAKCVGPRRRGARPRHPARSCAGRRTRGGIGGCARGARVSRRRGGRRDSRRLVRVFGSCGRLLTVRAERDALRTELALVDDERLAQLDLRIRCGVQLAQRALGLSTGVGFNGVSTREDAAETLGRCAALRAHALVLCVVAWFPGALAAR
mmetsp:Transcript_105482/g.304942  ORF Transcript_105482/g.304942 Transcript_105482/m.304942 type:complete len:415 (+) Transcript_105482:510-1754(+)